MAARKKKAGKKPVRKTAARRTTAQRLEAELPASLRDFSRLMRRSLTRIEKRIELTGKDVRRRLTRLLRDGSHELGRLEAAGERRWRKQSRQARHDAARMLRRLEKAIDPAPRKKKKTTRRRTTERAGSGI